jgi:hypothetical protein
VRHVIVHVDHELEMLQQRLWGDRSSDCFDFTAGVEVQRLELELIGFHLGKIQDVGHDRVQRVGAAANRAGVVALRVIELGLQEQRGHAENAVHRRANLVAHVGQEFTLGPARGLGGLGGEDECLARLAGFGDILQ